MEHLTKTFYLKAREDNGGVEGYFSTYEKEPDSYGDIIEPGAFTNTIEKRKAPGHPFPLCFNHDFDKIIGVVDSIEEKENGPFISAHFLDTELAQDVRKFVQSGAVYQFSFAYDVLKRRDPDDEEKIKGVTNVLQEVEVYEVSIVTVPANQNAVVTDVKAMEPEVKEGKRNSKADAEALRKIISLAQGILGELEDTNPEDEEKEESKEAESEVKEASEEPKADGNLKESAQELLEKIKTIKEDSV